jgi:hypothetical protein
MGVASPPSLPRQDSKYADDPLLGRDHASALAARQAHRPGIETGRSTSPDSSPVN